MFSPQSRFGSGLQSRTARRLHTPDGQTFEGRHWRDVARALAVCQGVLAFVDHSPMRTVLGVKGLVAKIFGSGPHVEEDAIAELAQE